MSVQANEGMQGFSDISGFNTSYVSVQELKNEIKDLEESCFNTSYVSVQEMPF